MSVVFLNQDSDTMPNQYPAQSNDHGGLHFPPAPPVHDLLAYEGAEDGPLMPNSPSSADLGSPNLLGPLSPPESLSIPASTGHGPRRQNRQKAIPKPDRPVTMNHEGKYVCMYPGCDQKVKVFTRQCEWGKHMDKHERPYKCNHPSCKNNLGFTYSGGLSRHGREVHGTGGGPPKSLLCPHKNCKRHEGKAFSRPENLNEHLRRVHTADKTNHASTAAESPEALPESVPPEVQSGPAEDIQAILATAALEQTGQKRKADMDLREEVKRLRLENQELRATTEAQNRQCVAMMERIHELGRRLDSRDALQSDAPVAQPPRNL
ncbi:hypothetical protein GGR54DRAFT_539779 [Hypoxylon sp. NC1633]|nr:hypothetical protein GGR54DRAFT_539779 [Hypoxylon sp. NC1633]